MNMAKLLGPACHSKSSYAALKVALTRADSLALLAAIDALYPAIEISRYVYFREQEPLSVLANAFHLGIFTR